MNYVIMHSGVHNIGNYFFMYISAYSLSKLLNVPLLLPHKPKLLFLDEEDLTISNTVNLEGNKNIYLKTHEKNYTQYVDLVAAHKNLAIHASYSMNMFLHDKHKDKFKQLVRDKRETPYYDENYLVINIRAGDIMGLSKHGDYNLIPHSYYKKIIKTTGLKPVFIGQIDTLFYETIQKNFTDAIILEFSKDAYFDFEVIRRAKNKCISVSTFSYLAAYFGEDDTNIYMPMLGLFNPLQRPDLDFVLPNDTRFVYDFSFPVEKWEASSEQIDKVFSI